MFSKVICTSWNLSNVLFLGLPSRDSKQRQLPSHPDVHSKTLCLKRYLIIQKPYKLLKNIFVEVLQCSFLPVQISWWPLGASGPLSSLLVCDLARAGPSMKLIEMFAWGSGLMTQLCPSISTALLPHALSLQTHRTPFHTFVYTVCVFLFRIQGERRAVGTPNVPAGKKRQMTSCLRHQKSLSWPSTWPCTSLSWKSTKTFKKERKYFWGSWKCLWHRLTLSELPPSDEKYSGGRDELDMVVSVHSDPCSCGPEDSYSGDVIAEVHSQPCTVPGEQSLETQF